MSYVRGGVRWHVWRVAMSRRINASPMEVLSWPLPLFVEALYALDAADDIEEHGRTVAEAKRAAEQAAAGGLVR